MSLQPLQKPRANKRLQKLSGERKQDKTRLKLWRQLAIQLSGLNESRRSLTDLRIKERKSHGARRKRKCGIRIECPGTLRNEERRNKLYPAVTKISSKREGNKIERKKKRMTE